MNSILEAQKDMREAYANGIPGVLSSGSVWVIAGVVALLANPVSGILTLVFGGTLIFPLSVILCKIIGRTGKHSKNNPLAPLALEGTFWMLLSIPIAGGAAFYKLEWFFPAMILVIAGRYLTFSTIYGLRIFWFFGVALMLCSFTIVILNAPVFIGAFSGGVVELVFALIIFKFTQKTESNKSIQPTAKASAD